MKIRLANPRGFCAGVDRAIEIVEQAIAQLGAPVYVRHEVVHNRYVVEDLKKKGAIFVDEVGEVPDGATVIFSAHGVSKAVQAEARRPERRLTVLDATCPLVTKVHLEVIRNLRENREIILIGHQGHPEVEGTMGQAPAQKRHMHLVETVEDVAQLSVDRPDNLAYVTQTTLSMDDTAGIIDALRRRFPSISGPKKNDICYATQNRQDAVKALAKQSDLILVVGSRNSSNSNRLREIADRFGLPAYLVDHKEQLQSDWFRPDMCVGITAGASAPEILVQDIIQYLEQNFDASVEEMDGIQENIVFQLPRALQKNTSSSP
ncbi:MAG: 4-hydroxy-3-methylbut-2-enyl diphosphate reductase [Gammaproteobacteria bacterium]|nr:MAG: 4-hydroxy-3-methylbut-2-enyl diphosphate reductase [Gammaproteobacteria bacterium]